MTTYLALAVVAILLILIIVIAKSGTGGKIHEKPFEFEEPHEEAGRLGEEWARTVIERFCREYDHIFANVKVFYEGQKAELDVVVVNQCGVFVFEVKNWSGRLIGGEDDYNWERVKATPAGNVYREVKRNPIKQLNREIYIFKNCLKNLGFHVWIEGKVFFPRWNKTIRSPQILANEKEIDRFIHTPGKKQLSKRTVAGICRLLEKGTY